MALRERIPENKERSERVHHCDECGHTTDWDFAAAIVVEQRGAECTAAFLLESHSSRVGSFAAVGQIVKLAVEEGCSGTPVKQQSLRSDLGKLAVYCS